MVGTDGGRIYRFKALTDIWTGNTCGTEKDLITTGLLGSLRWWYEVLVRGLGGYACDPIHTTCKGRDHCVACGLFGCTGWARKFRFQVLDDKGQVMIEQIKAGTFFQFVFTPLRPIQPAEWSLLDATLRLIADYGAIGGKTSILPPMADYGIIKLLDGENLTLQEKTFLPYSEILKYTKSERWRNELRKSDFQWASLEHFWHVKGKSLTRRSVTQSLGNNASFREWTLGKGGTSKKLFSFQTELPPELPSPEISHLMERVP